MFGFEVELFFAFLFFFSWLIAPSQAEEKVQVKKEETHQSKVVNVESAKESDSIEQNISKLKIRQARILARKLNIKQKVGRKSRSKAQLIEQILKRLTTDRKNTEVAFNEFLTELTEQVSERH